MKISKVIKNITEIQHPLWVSNLSEEDIEKIEDQFWLVWMKLKQINDMDIIEPLVKISEFLSIKEMKDGKLNVKLRKVEFGHFYSICISLIPKKKYTFISSKKKKKKDYDYEFLKLLSKDLEESIHNCEDYHDVYEELGILEDEKVKLFDKYGIEYEPKSTDIIEIVNINSINVHPKRNKTKSRSKEYLILLEKIKIFGLLEPIIVEKKTNYIVSGNMRYRCCKELRKRRISVIKKEFKFDVLNLINFEMDKGKLLSERVNEYRKLNQEIKNLGYKDRNKLMGGVNLRKYLFKQTGISQTQVNKLEFIERNDLELYNKVLLEEVAISKVYLELKKSNKIIKG